MTRPEQNLQIAIVIALHHRFDCLISHVPNQGRRGLVEAGATKRMGLLTGHPDLIVYGRDGRAFHLEVKDKVQARERAVAPGERFASLSTDQKRVVPDLRERGFHVAVVDTVEDAIAAGAAFGLAPRRGARPEPATEF
ncbi:VRR-NUC domain-containing protein [Methylobacterium isbiliense]|uniref:VRR-NUC domain-containing protein n=1 Tax=Methylobacterium isbiliense TaxID=315478 RepID=A0ABQ4SF78_9HYPH|nr:VRR-NUC domain-containing protein [Methylobacterium isbiliense]MDN3622574.1 VRR-NUC domain-containing protein [Methylobacterium isbiliense]GJE00578.1 hypothetical protein GMJLKIPL_2501 [Methylobacterium isbiliense]